MIIFACFVDFSGANAAPDFTLNADITTGVPKGAGVGVIVNEKALQKVTLRKEGCSENSSRA